jgi:hypothetical protein
MKCLYCGINDVIIGASGKPRKYCSDSCQWTHTVKKTRETNLKKYGTTNPMQLSEIKTKRDNTNIEKYGVKNPFSLAEFQQKQRETCKERFGVEHASQNLDIQEKIKQSWNKYDGGHPFSDKEIRKKRDDTMLARHGVIHPCQSESIQKKMEQTCLKLYGVKNPASFSEFSNKISSSLTNGNSEYLKNPEWLEEHIANMGIRGVAEILQVSSRCVREYCDQHGIEFRKTMAGSEFEQQVFLEISKLIPNVDIIRGDRELIGKELDIYIPSLHLAFECNGVYWHSETNGRGRLYHLDKTKSAAEKGVHLVHIWDNQWNNRRELIISRIKSLLKMNKRIPARKCKVVNLTPTETKKFLNDNHIQRNCGSSFRYGLIYNNEVVAVMTMGKSRYNKNSSYELLRFCSKIGINVIGGSSKLFKYFISTVNPTSVISYSDKSFNTGKSYLNLGFKYSHSSSPSYHYTKDYVNLENRVKFQKHKLKNILTIYVDTDTEYENMINNGYDRIWDCGTDVWIFTSS